MFGGGDIRMRGLKEVSHMSYVMESQVYGINSPPFPVNKKNKRVNRSNIRNTCVSVYKKESWTMQIFTENRTIITLSLSVVVHLHTMLGLSETTRTIRKKSIV